MAVPTAAGAVRVSGPAARVRLRVQSLREVGRRRSRSRACKPRAATARRLDDAVEVPLCFATERSEP